MNAYGSRQFNLGQLDMIIIEHQFFFFFFLTSPKMNSIQHGRKKKKPSSESRLQLALQRTASWEWGHWAEVGTRAGLGLSPADSDHRPLTLGPAVLRELTPWPSAAVPQAQVRAGKWQLQFLPKEVKS